MEVYICTFCKKQLELTSPNVISNHLQWHCKEWKKYKEEILTKDFLYTEHWVNGKSCNEIALEHGVRSSCSINKLLNTYGLGTRNIKQSKAEKRCKEKTEMTHLERHGSRHNFCKSHPSRTEWEKRLLDEENITNVFQREDVKRKIVAHHIREYGFASHMQNDDFKKKFFDDYEKEHGYRFPVQSPNNKFGGTISKPQKHINEYLLSINIDTKMEHSVYPFRVDILVKESNKVIEIFGDYWHANPIKYKETDAIKFPRHTNITLVKHIWDRDKRRLSYIKEAGFDVLVLWEYEINKEFETVKEKIKSFLNL